MKTTLLMHRKDKRMCCCCLGNYKVTKFSLYLVISGISAEKEQGGDQYCRASGGNGWERLPRTGSLIGCPLGLKTAFTFGAPQGGRVLSEDSTSLMVVLIESQLLATVIATQCPGFTLPSAG